MDKLEASLTKTKFGRKISGVTRGLTDDRYCDTIRCKVLRGND